MPIQQDVFKRSTAEVGDFVKGLRENSKRDGTFDSAAAQDYVSTALNQNTGVKVPQELQIVLDEAKEDLQKNQIIRAVLDSCDGYREAHGVDAPADIVEQALHNAYATTNYAKKQYSLDSADNLHHDQLSLQPNRAVVSIISTIVEACPFAHYLPADIGSNEARLAILSHQAGDKFGGYKANDLIDGINSGEPYMLSSRLHTAMPNGSGVVTGKITAVQTDADHCDQSAGDLKLLRGRAVVYIDGRIAAVETPTTTGSGNSPISGTIAIGDTSYSITGNINTDTGAYTLNTSPALPQTVPVAVEGFIDFERAGDLTPTIITHVDTFALYAKSARARTHLSIDSRTQMSNELGLDPLSESVVAINAQYNNETLLRRSAQGYAPGQEQHRNVRFQQGHHAPGCFSPGRLVRHRRSAQHHQPAHGRRDDQPRYYPHLRGQARGLSACRYAEHGIYAVRYHRSPEYLSTRPPLQHGRCVLHAEGCSGNG